MKVKKNLTQTTHIFLTAEQTLISLKFFIILDWEWREKERQRDEGGRGLKRKKDKFRPPEKAYFIPM